MSTRGPSNVVSLRKAKSYQQLWREAGHPTGGGLKMMAEAEASGALADQLGYTEPSASEQTTDTSAE